MTPYTNLTCDSPGRQGTTGTRAPQNRSIGFTHLGPSGWVTTSAYSASGAECIVLTLAVALTLRGCGCRVSRWLAAASAGFLCLYAARPVIALTFLMAA
jgi:hypothetical protein